MLGLRLRERLWLRSSLGLGLGFILDLDQFSARPGEERSGLEQGKSYPL